MNSTHLYMTLILINFFKELFSNVFCILKYLKEKFQKSKLYETCRHFRNDSPSRTQHTQPVEMLVCTNTTRNVSKLHHILQVSQIRNS